MVLQIFVEKKKEYDSMSRKLLHHLFKATKLDDRADIRVFRKYIVENVGTEYYEIIKHRILSDETVENVFMDFLPITSEYKRFEVKAPKNQFDKDEENIKKCFALCGISVEKGIKKTLVYAVGTNLKETAFRAVKNALVTAGYEAVVEPERISNSKKNKANKYVIDGFIKMNDIDVYQFHRKNNIKMTSEDFCKLRDYFRVLGRDPMWLEVLAIDSCWSKARREPQTRLEKIEIKDSALNVPVEIALDEYLTARRALYGDRKVPITLNDIASIGLMALKQRGQATDVDRLSDGKLQISLPVDIDGVYEQWALTFKSSNCSNDKGFDYFGEAVSDHLTDRTAAYQAVSINNIGAENIKNGNFDMTTLKMNEANAKFMAHCGVSVCDYNSVVANAEKMNVKFTASAAAAPKTNMQKPVAGANDAVIMLGGKLGLNDLPHHDIIQKNDPEIMQNVLSLLREPKAATMIKRMTDMANGLVSGLLDITDDGVIIDIDRVIKTDITKAPKAISRPNEGVLVLCDKENAPQFMSLARRFGLSAHNVAITDNEQSFRFFTKGEQIAVLERKFLKYNSEKAKSSVIISTPSNSKLFTPLSEEFCKQPINEVFIKNLAQNSYNEPTRTDNPFDWSIGSRAVSVPFGGKYQSTPEEAHICKIPSNGKTTNTVTVMSYGSTPKITSISPFHGAAYSTMEAISKIVASGGNSLDIKLATSEHFLDPATAPIKWSEPVGAMLGAFEAQMSMGLPCVCNTPSIEPIGNFKSAFAFTAFAVAGAKTNEIISAEFKTEDSTVLLIPMPIVPKTGMPDFDKAKIMYRQFHYLSQSSKVISAAVVKTGGVAATVAKMSFGNNIGVHFTNSDYNTLFGDKTASIIVETKNPGAFSGMDTVKIGTTVKDDHFIFDNAKISIAEALAAYRNQNEKSYWRLLSKNIVMADIPIYPTRFEVYNGDKFLKPHVVIPTFGSEIGESDIINAFEATGADVIRYAFDYKHINESKETLASIIEKAQILCIPNCDETLSSVNLPVFALSDTRVNQSLQTFMIKGGLVLGLGSGFKALLKLGLLGINANSASFAPNVNAQCASGLVKTRVTSVKSPWFANCEPGAVYTSAVSNTFGRFVADEATLTLLSANGRIALQYVDLNGKPTAKMPFNPSGSTCAIEGITSANGAVLGKMALVDRYTDNCYSNVPGSKDMKIFEAGVKYFM